MNSYVILILYMISGNTTKEIPTIAQFSDIEECDDVGFYMSQDLAKNFNQMSKTKVKITHSCIEKKN